MKNTGLKNMDKLYGWLFHYNHITSTWTAFKREDNVKFFNGDKGLKTYSDKSDIKNVIKQILKNE